MRKLTVLVAVLVPVLAGCGSSNSNHADSIAQNIMSTGGAEIQDNLSTQTALNPAAGASYDVSMVDANCTRVKQTQNYNCGAEYEVQNLGDTQALPQDFSLQISGSCDSSGNCSWSSDGPGTPVGPGGSSGTTGPGNSGAGNSGASSSTTSTSSTTTPTATTTGTGHTGAATTTASTPRPRPATTAKSAPISHSHQTTLGGALTLSASLSNLAIITKVTAVRNLAGDQFNKPHAGTHFAGVFLSWDNTGNKTFNDSPGNDIELIMSGGKTIPSTITTLSSCSDPGDLKVHPGQTTATCVTFAEPNGQQVKAVRVSLDSGNDPASEWTLG